MRMAGSPFIVTVCDRHAVNSMREDEVTGPDGGPPVVPVAVTDIDPPSGHEKVTVRDRTFGETDVAAVIVAWLRVAATMLAVVEAPDPGEVGGSREGADGP